jgi:hypothetical protein
MRIQPLDHSRLKVFPLATRKSLTQIEEILVAPESAPANCSGEVLERVASCAEQIRKARAGGRAVMLIYGAHLLRNGAALILERLMAEGWLTHLATNGAGTIHDWEFAFLGRSSESVRENVATGTFGAWEETGRAIHLALMAGSLREEGYGQSLGRFIVEDGIDLPSTAELKEQIMGAPENRLTPSRAAVLRMMVDHRLASGRHQFEHRWKGASLVAHAYRHGIPLTAHPGIGYDIISNHPMFNGALIGRAAELDFKWFSGSVDQLDEGVVLSIGSAIMGPQVFEKSLSCVNNLRLQEGRDIVKGHSIYVVDLQEGGGWDWRQGEPPKSNPAYYLRFCKSYARMGGEMHYVCCDNLAFAHQLYRQLQEPDPHLPARGSE